MKPRLSDEQISNTFQRAITKGDVIGNDDTSVIFYDMSFLEERVRDLISLFPKTTLHAIAIKANPLTKILRYLNNFGIGVEAASLPELHIALNAGFSSDKIVFDSPVKTKKEIEYALNLGVHINADSFTELDRINEIVGKSKRKGTIGVRINPQVGTGAILTTSTAGNYSKFGIPIKEFREELIESFLQFNWLSGVHLHIGSQGCNMEMLLYGYKTIIDFVDQVNELLQKEPETRQIDIIDIGGGLPISYSRNIQPASMMQYKNALEKTDPELFSGKYKLITEFGRYIHTNTGWVASRVEYVKRDENINTAMIHVGADLFIRECYNPNDWKHEIIVLDPKGQIKSGSDKNKYMIAGPLCFAGDLIAREIILPKVEIDDYIIIRDAGAYTLSMWSRYNSRQIPKVIGYYQDGGIFEVLKEKESIEKILGFWD